MNSARKLTVALAALVAVSAGNAMSAQPESHKASASASLSPSERGALAHAFVKKWGPYAQQVYGVDVGTWANRMVGTFTTADPTNFKRSLQRSTYEGALATLDGAGHKVSDAQVIDALAKADGPISQGDLGDTTNDLVFTQLTPCRIVDTRSTAAGKIAAGTSRGFYAWGFASFTNQGGSATDCGGLLNESPQAIVVNVTVVGQTESGYATLFPADAASPPLAANMIYYPGVIQSNAATVQLGTVGVVDFKIFSERLADYVVDIVGFYDAPHATALDCTNVFSAAATVVPVGSFVNVPDASIEACPAQYDGVAYVWDYQSGTGGVSVWNNDYGTTIGLSHAPYTSTGNTNMNLLMGRRCCRVPGR